jgi:hypothetical protein
MAVLQESSQAEHLHHLVAEVVDDLHRDPARLRPAERAGDADAGSVLVGAVVEVFDVRTACDRGVDALLPLDAGFPPGGVGLRDVGGPFGVEIARDLPFFPGLAERGVEASSEGFEGRLGFLPDDVEISRRILLIFPCITCYTPFTR